MSRDSSGCGIDPSHVPLQRISMPLPGVHYQSQAAPNIDFAPAGPTQFRAAAARIGTDFFRSGAHNFARDLGIQSVAFTRLERLLHSPIFARMKCQNGDATTSFETERKVAEKRLQGAELVVHGNSQRLKDTADGVFMTSGAPDDGGQLCRRRYR